MSQGNGALFQMQVERLDEVVRITLLGEFDMLSEQRFTQAMAELGSAWTAMVLDLRRLEFIDSTGVRLILDEERRASAAGRRFSVLVGQGPARRVFRLLGLDSGFVREEPEDEG
jgi:anti-sigma B factor antagonist